MRAVSAGLSRAAASGSNAASFARFSSTGASRTRAPHLGVDRRHRRDPVEQGAQIQPRPADQDRQPAAGVNVRDLPPRHRRPVRRGAGQGAILDAVQPMLGSLTLRRRVGAALRIGRSR